MEPENPGNVGAVARVMQNFNLKSLVLINPKADHLCHEAISRAKHASSILKKAKVMTKDCLKSFDCVIGTTARLGTDYNIPRRPLTPTQLSGALPKAAKIALLFGREGIGLSNAEIRKCDLVVHIPTKSVQPTMNLSHAVAIVLYELARKSTEKQLAKRFTPATRKERDLLLRKVDAILSGMDFPTPEKRETQRMVWKRMINQSFLTRREAFALFGFFRKLQTKKL